MDKVKHFIGIDISKETIDAAVIINLDKNKPIHRQFPKGIDLEESFLGWLRELQVPLNDETLICMEHTGLYNRSVVDFLSKQKATLWVEMALHIKRSMGLQRGKSDKIDAGRIALFAMKNRDEAKPWNPLDADVQRLKDLLMQRERLVQTRVKLEVPVNEFKDEGLTDLAAELQKLQKPAINGIQKSLDKVEAAIKKIISSNTELNKIFCLLITLKGVGEVTSWHFIAYTNGFKKLNAGKQLACYCGVVPFENQSGKSIIKTPRISKMANMRLKKLLHTAALSAIGSDPELRTFYKRKREEGKSHKSVLNAIRNKIVLRMIAIIRDERPYEIRGQKNAA